MNIVFTHTDFEGDVLDIFEDGTGRITKVGGETLCGEVKIGPILCTVTSAGRSLFVAWCARQPSTKEGIAENRERARAALGLAVKSAPAPQTADAKPRGVKAQWWLFPWDALDALERPIYPGREGTAEKVDEAIRRAFLPAEALVLAQMDRCYLPVLWGSLVRELGPDALEQVLAVLEYGARKYKPDNWRKAGDAGIVSFRREYFSAIARHIRAASRGEEFDPIEATPPGSGLRHYAHSACGVLFWQWHEMLAIGSTMSPSQFFEGGD
jgi:hypothetical protein